MKIKQLFIKNKKTFTVLFFVLFFGTVVVYLNTFKADAPKGETIMTFDMLSRGEDGRNNPLPEKMTKIDNSLPPGEIKELKVPSGDENSSVESRIDGKSKAEETDIIDGSYIVKFGESAIENEINKIEPEKKSEIKNRSPEIKRNFISISENNLINDSKVKSISNDIQVDTKYSGLLFNGAVVNNVSIENKKKLENMGYKLEPNLEVKAHLNSSALIIQADKVWEQKTSDGSNNITGVGIRVGILDTGIDYTHPDFGSCTTDQVIAGNCAKVAGGENFLPDNLRNKDNPTSFQDDNGHGTHVASTVAGNGALKGIAPNAILYSYKVLAASGSGSMDGILRALERAADPNQDGSTDDHLDIVNLSLGASGSIDDAESTEYANVINRITDIGVLVVVAAGNDGNDHFLCKYLGGGDAETCLKNDFSKNSGTIGFPGSLNSVLTVGATHKMDQGILVESKFLAYKKDELAYFSSSGPASFYSSQKVVAHAKPEVVAPGVSICAAKSSVVTTAIQSLSTCVDAKHVSMHGTSMATPHVAGEAALIKQAHPDWTARQIKQAIIDGSVAVDTKNPGIYGNGRVDALASVGTPEPPEITLDPNQKVYNENKETPNHIFTAFIRGNGLSKYNFYVSKINSMSQIIESWELVSSKSMFSFIGNHSILTEVDDLTLNDGNYMFKLEVVDGGDHTHNAYGHFTVNKIEFNKIYEGLRFPLGSTVDVSTNLTKNYSSKLTTTYSCLNNAGSNSEGFIQGGGLVLSQTNCSANSPILIRAQYLDGDDKKAEREVNIYIDEKLRSGWPVTLSYAEECIHTSSFLCRQDTIFGPPVIVDINDDGQEEIIFYAHRRGSSQIPKLYVLSHDGKVLWSKTVGSFNATEYNNSPVIAEYEGKKYIYTYSPNGDIFTGGSAMTSLVINTRKPQVYAFDGNGNLATGWPKEIPYYGFGTLMAADFDNDQSDEVVVRVIGGRKPGFYVFNGRGDLLSNVIEEQVSPSIYNGMLNQGAVGDIDGDKQMEIVITSSTAAGDALVRAYNYKGELKNVSKLREKATYYSPVIGDTDMDGKQEIAVIGYDHVTYKNFLEILDGNGQSKPGFPLDLGDGTDYLHPELGLKRVSWNVAVLAFSDVNQDGYLEAVITGFQRGFHRGFVKFVINKNGEILESKEFVEPYMISNITNYPIIGDINNDGQEEILLSSLKGIRSLSGDQLTDMFYSSGTTYSSFPQLYINDNKTVLVNQSLYGNVVREENYYMIGGYIYNLDTRFTEDFFSPKHGTVLSVWDLGIDNDKASWPSFKHDNRLTASESSGHGDTSYITISMPTEDSVYVGEELAISPTVRNANVFDWKFIDPPGPGILNLSSNNTMNTAISSTAHGSYLLRFTASNEFINKISDITLNVHKFADIDGVPSSGGEPIVDFSDFSLLLSNWGTPSNKMADIDKTGDSSGMVDFYDFSALLSNWGK